jgi:hypothetical protein
MTPLARRQSAYKNASTGTGIPEIFWNGKGILCGDQNPRELRAVFSNIMKRGTQQLKRGFCLKIKYFIRVPMVPNNTGTRVTNQ